MGFLTRTVLATLVGGNTRTVHSSTKMLFKRYVLGTLGWSRRMVHTHDYVNTTSTKGTDNLYRDPSAGMKQESKGKTGFIFVPQIPISSVLQNRYDGVINSIYCEWYGTLLLWLCSRVCFILASKIGGPSLLSDTKSLYFPNKLLSEDSSDRQPSPLWGQIL